MESDRSQPQESFKTFSRWFKEGQSRHKTCSWLLEDVKVDVCVRVYCILAQLQREITCSVRKPDDLFQMQPRTQNHVYKTTTRVFPHSRTVHIDIIKVFYLPNDAQESCFKIILKFTLKHLLHVSVQSPSSGSVLFELAKVIVVTIIN
jgi:hypothetical protein